MLQSGRRHPVEEVGVPIFHSLMRGLPKLRALVLLFGWLADQLKWPTMTPEQVKIMTLSCPHMQSFTVQFSLSLPPLQAMTLAWPSLVSLTFSTLYIPASVDSTKSKPHSLYHLSISTFRQVLKPENPPPAEQVARILDAMFPELKDCSLPQVYCEVMGVLTELQAGRVVGEGSVTIRH
ncbi:hypothetical protein JAAARDRAFT_434623 [Jaapia argillacea MUCL 33604]|uniref:Uncharacterized protein n=1 Tax=Jaapia argillacea MUCL 33604 TaxID=933084 RepID=A0A067PEW1_9AGAM|nr:hypothetical protein JAAARDRAFT_434623 [Jaapia argillacea MUCL 33604]